MTRWLHEYQALIYRVVMSYEADHSAREDLFQDIALSLWRSIDRFAGGSKESTWIYKVALNTAIDHARKAVRTPRTSQFDETTHWVQIQPPREDITWVYEKIRALEVVERSLMLLYLDGNSYDDIANILGISPNSVGAKINRVKGKLQALFNKETQT
ncbi:MAG: RNA polymerase sigma factor [Pseudomonadales bacterium]|nr:RNA polymerase sigma factor [Pseudomonadales bacterium]